MLKTILILVLVSFVADAQRERKRVCMVGAGPAGLIAAKYFSNYPTEFKPIVFEKNSNVGGLWIYTDSTTVDENGLPVHSSMYKNLRTNTIKELMLLPDYPKFKDDASNGRFVTHDDFLQYQRNFTANFNLRRFIRFNTNVEKVEALPGLRWLIVSRNLKTLARSETTCDAVILCNGRNVKGYVPVIPGIESFTGRTLHSHVYRIPETFANQTVLILGAKTSGIDISVDISSKAKKVYLSHRGDSVSSLLPSNLEQVPGVVAAENGELVLSNGTKLRADALIYCTGYRYDFPFLQTETSGIVVGDGRYIRPVYKHMINIEYPTMAIIGLPIYIYFYLAAPAQINYFGAVLRGQLSLPSREQMMIDVPLPTNATSAKRHVPTFNEFYKYFDELVVPLNGTRLPWWIIPYWKSHSKEVSHDYVHFKDKKFVLHENNRTAEFV